MSLILNIDTSGEMASICLDRDGKITGYDSQDNQKEQAAWLHPAIQRLLKAGGYQPSELTAVGVSIGPGSYTGLRVGLASAKGLCYALNIPLLTAGTLEMMARSVKEEATELICPMIDARRMEVYMAVYDKELREIMKPVAMILDENSLSEWRNSHSILCCGSGAGKMQSLIVHSSIQFSETLATARHLAEITGEKYHQKTFADLAYTEPLYLKEFYFPT